MNKQQKIMWKNMPKELRSVMAKLAITPLQRNTYERLLPKPAGYTGI